MCLGMVTEHQLARDPLCTQVLTIVCLRQGGVPTTIGRLCYVVTPGAESVN
jgi:hypothetical protein